MSIEKVVCDWAHASIRSVPGRKWENHRGSGRQVVELGKTKYNSVAHGHIRKPLLKRFGELSDIERQQCQLYMTPVYAEFMGIIPIIVTEDTVILLEDLQVSKNPTK